MEFHQLTHLRHGTTTTDQGLSSPTPELRFHSREYPQGMDRSETTCPQGVEAINLYELEKIRWNGMSIAIGWPAGSLHHRVSAPHVGSCSDT